MSLKIYHVGLKLSGNFYSALYLKQKNCMVVVTQANLIQIHN